MRLIDANVLFLNNSEVTDQALQAFQQLSEEADSLLIQGWTAEEIFWSRYFWFGVFVRKTNNQKGFDAGLEQQLLHLLETPFPDCSLDWSVLESIDARISETIGRTE